MKAIPVIDHGDTWADNSKLLMSINHLDTLHLHVKMIDGEPDADQHKKYIFWGGGKMMVDIDEAIKYYHQKSPKYSYNEVKAWALEYGYGSSYPYFTALKAALEANGGDPDAKIFPTYLGGMGGDAQLSTLPVTIRRVKH